jgi:hypothetical protein
MKSRGGDGFALESLFEFCIRHELGVNALQHSQTIQTGLTREDYEPHSARAQLAFDGIPAETAAD